MRDKKALWLTFPLFICSYGLGNVKDNREEGEALGSYHFREEKIKRNNPLDIVSCHCIM